MVKTRREVARGTVEVAAGVMAAARQVSGGGVTTSVYRVGMAWRRRVWEDIGPGRVVRGSCGGACNVTTRSKAHKYSWNCPFRSVPQGYTVSTCFL